MPKSSSNFYFIHSVSLRKQYVQKLPQFGTALIIEFFGNKSIKACQKTNCVFFEQYVKNLRTVNKLAKNKAKKQFS